MTRFRTQTRSVQWLLLSFVGLGYFFCFGLVVLVRLSYVLNLAEFNSSVYFPSTQQVLDLGKASGNRGMLFLGPLALACGFPLTLELLICWVLKIDPIPTFHKNKSLYSGAFALTFVGAVGSICSVLPLFSNWLFQFDPSQIREIQISVEKSDCTTFVIKDRNLINEGFKWLNTANTKPMPSKYFIGRKYSIKLIPTHSKAKFNYLMIYEYDSSNSRGEIIRPQQSSDYNPFGGYISDEFFDWLDKNVKHIFKNVYLNDPQGGLTKQISRQEKLRT